MIFQNKDKTEIMGTCTCGCENGIRFRIMPDDDEFYSVLTYYSGNWYKEQDMTCWNVIISKLKKIWAILRNKDFYYSEILFTKEESQEFKEYINEMIKD